MSNYSKNGRKKDYWEYIELGSKCKTWDRFRRAIYCRLINNVDQLYLPGCSRDELLEAAQVGG